ncbi:MAG: sigma-70 family RNA polymerase sigma factor [Bdellovibrionales bacterium]|nr:sigma-70 family RNA polymerase sigma factor [Bdellovibrionales bacterium]
MGNSRKRKQALTRDELIIQFKDFVHFVVGRLISTMKLPNSMFEELTSAGYLGLVEAAERYDSTQGTNFKNYAFLRIRGAVIDSIRKSSDISGEAYRHAKAFEAIQTLREEESYDHHNSTKQSKSKLAKALNHIAKGALVFRINMPTEELEEVYNSDCSKNDPETQLELKEYSKKIFNAMKKLSEKERIIIEEYYFNDYSFAEITKKHKGLSKSWVSRLHSKAIEKLQNELIRNEIS